MDAIKFCIGCCESAQSHCRYLSLFEQMVIKVMTSNASLLASSQICAVATKMAALYGEDEDEVRDGIGTSRMILNAMVSYFLWMKAAEQSASLSNKCTFEDLQDTIEVVASKFAESQKAVVFRDVVNEMQKHGYIRD